MDDFWFSIAAYNDISFEISEPDSDGECDAVLDGWTSEYCVSRVWECDSSTFACPSVYATYTMHVNPDLQGNLDLSTTTGVLAYFKYSLLGENSGCKITSPPTPPFASSIWASV